MNNFHKILLTLLFAVTSSSAIAVANPSYAEVRAAIENTLAKVEETKSAMDNGVDKDLLIDMVTKARQLQKDIANNNLDVKRNQASAVLKKVRIALKSDNMDAAKTAIADAISRYQEIKRLYAASH